MTFKKYVHIFSFTSVSCKVESPEKNPKTTNKKVHSLIQFLAKARQLCSDLQTVSLPMRLLWDKLAQASKNVVQTRRFIVANTFYGFLRVFLGTLVEGLE